MSRRCMYKSQDKDLKWIEVWRQDFIRVWMLTIYLSKGKTKSRKLGGVSLWRDVPIDFELDKHGIRELDFLLPFNRRYQ